MAILFKTYNGRHQLHFYGENWQVATSSDLKKVFAEFDKKNATKIVVAENNGKIEIMLNQIIVDCTNLSDLKKRFGIFAEFKEKFQKSIEEKKVVKKKKIVKKKIKN